MQGSGFWPSVFIVTPATSVSNDLRLKEEQMPNKAHEFSNTVPRFLDGDDCFINLRIKL